MAHYGTLKDARIADASEDIRGSHLYGTNDEKLGKIDDVIVGAFHLGPVIIEGDVLALGVFPGEI